MPHIYFAPSIPPLNSVENSKMGQNVLKIPLKVLKLGVPKQKESEIKNKVSG